MPLQLQDRSRGKIYVSSSTSNVIVNLQWSTYFCFLPSWTIRHSPPLFFRMQHKTSAKYDQLRRKSGWSRYFFFALSMHSTHKSWQQDSLSVAVAPAQECVLGPEEPSAPSVNEESLIRMEQKFHIWLKVRYCSRGSCSYRKQWCHHSSKLELIIICHSSGKNQGIWAHRNPHFLFFRTLWNRFSHLIVV